MPDYHISVVANSCLIGNAIDLEIDVVCKKAEVESQESLHHKGNLLSLDDSDIPARSTLQHDLEPFAQSGAEKSMKSVTFDLNNLDAIISKRPFSPSSHEHDEPDRLSILLAQVSGGFVLDKTICSENFSHLLDLHTLMSGGALTLHEKDRGTSFFDGLKNTFMKSVQSAPDSEQLRASRLGTLPIFFLPPTILAVDMEWHSKQHETFRLMLNLPADLPPTFHGSFVQITYTLELTLQRINGQSRTLIFQLPATNISLQSDYDFTKPYILHNSASRGLAVGVTELSAQDSPYNDAGQKDFENYLQLLCDQLKVGKHSRPYLPSMHLAASEPEEVNLIHKYDLVQENKQLGIVSLSKITYKAGDVISGFIVFPNSVLRCSRYSISLESTEVVNDQYVSVATRDDGLAQRQIGDSAVHQCAFLQRSQFEFLVPASIVPTFKTHLVELKYSLFLKFTTRGDPTRAVEMRTRHGIETTPPPAILEEHFDCRIPINIIHTSHQDFRSKRSCRF